MAVSFMELEVREEPLESATAQALIARLNEELRAMYPEPGATHFDLLASQMAGGRGAFFVARLGGEPVGCGAFRTLAPGVAEVKRMFVDPKVRGRRAGARILEAVEAAARTAGCTRFVLETGMRQLAAIALYERAGYRRVPLFGEYLRSPGTSICMRKGEP